MSTDGQRTKWRRNTADDFIRLSKVHERYRQTDDTQTDGRGMTYSEREREFTFAKNCVYNCSFDKKNTTELLIRLIYCD